MPSLGADMEEGTLVEQVISSGSAVRRGDIIAVVETQKGAIEIEVFEDGYLDKWLVPLGTKVPVGTPIATIRADAAPKKPDLPDKPAIPEQPDTPKPKDPGRLPSPREAPKPGDPWQSHPSSEVTEPTLDASTNPVPVQPEGVSPATRQRVTPAARRKAAQTGIDLSAFGTEKIISLNDLTGMPASASSGIVQPSAMRQAIAAAMSRSNREIPHYYLSDNIDLTAADDFVAAFNSDLPPENRLLMGALYVRAVARAAQDFPEFNGFFIDNNFLPSQAVHVGMAINLRSGGLVAPALHDAADGDLSALMSRLRDLVARVRQGRFKARELSDSTITVTSLGDRSVRQITGVIFPPQVAIIGIGTPGWQPVVQAQKIVARRTASISLAADHRVSDGHRGARFLRAIITNLQNPEAL